MFLQNKTELNGDILGILFLCFCSFFKPSSGVMILKMLALIASCYSFLMSTQKVLPHICHSNSRVRIAVQHFPRFFRNALRAVYICLT